LRLSCSEKNLKMHPLQSKLVQNGVLMLTGAHALVDGVGVSVDPLAKETGEVLQHVCLGRLTLHAGLVPHNGESRS
jgi:hypothetical protein